MRSSEKLPIFAPQTNKTISNMAKKFRIVHVKDNDEVFYAIKQKDSWWLPWDYVRKNRWTFRSYCGWHMEILKFKTEAEAEKYLRDELMEHDVSEYVVKEFGKPKFNLNFIKKDDSRNKEYVNNLNAKETVDRWGDL